MRILLVSARALSGCCQRVDGGEIKSDLPRHVDAYMKQVARDKKEGEEGRTEEP